MLLTRTVPRRDRERDADARGRSTRFSSRRSSRSSRSKWAWATSRGSASAPSLSSPRSQCTSSAVGAQYCAESAAISPHLIC